MKKLCYFIIAFAFYSNSMIAQKINSQKCVDIKLDEKYVLGDLFYGNDDYLYYTVNEVGKKSKYVTNKVAAIFKYDKNMQLVGKLLFSEIFNADDKKLTFFYPKIVGNNFVIITKNEELYSSITLDKELKVINKNPDFYELQKDYREDPNIIYSTDSSSLLLAFNRWETNTNLVKKDVEKTFICISSTGKKVFEKKVTTPGHTESEFLIKDVLFDNTNIYMVFNNFVLRKKLGVSPKTGERIKNYHLLKFNTSTNKLDEMLLQSDYSSYFISNSKLYYNNNTVYVIGTYYNEVNFMGAYRNGFDGFYMIGVTSDDKVKFSTFVENENDGIKGDIRNVFIKSDGGVYLVAENIYCNSYCNTGEITILNYDKDGKKIWQNLIYKDHHGAKLALEENYMYSCIFSEKDNVYVLFNDSKENAQLPADKPLNQFSGWNKDLYCLSFIIKNDGSILKNSLFNSSDLGCKFFTNGIYINKYQHKIYSLGINKMLILGYE